MKKDKEKEKARITNMLININPLAPESSIGKLFDKYVRCDGLINFTRSMNRKSNVISLLKVFVYNEVTNKTCGLSLQWSL